MQMKESITKFDLEAAFKALDDIDVPVTKSGIRANKAPLNEIFSKKTKFDALLEEYTEDTLTESENIYSWRRGRSEGQGADIAKYCNATDPGSDPRQSAYCLSRLIRDFCEIQWREQDNDLTAKIADAVLAFSDAAEHEKLTLSQIEQVTELLASWFDANNDNHCYLADQVRTQNKTDIATLRQHIQQAKKLDDTLVDIFIHAFESNCSAADRYEWSYMNDLRVKLAKLGYDWPFTRPVKLTEEYYDVSNQAELADAKESREAEIAKAKLARIEKIVDLDAESPEDLLTTYVGKYIIQCPQCMTLFYKNQEDIEESEDDPQTVNVNEVCQHCGNESGYTLIGKVGAAEAENPAEDAEVPSGDSELDDLNLGGEEGSTEDAESNSGNSDESEPADAEGSDFDLDSELAELDLEIEDDETKAEEAFYSSGAGSYLIEQVDDIPADAEAGEVAELNTLAEQLNLMESADELDITAAEFKELLSSSEFQTSVSPDAANAMLDRMDDTNVDEDLEFADKVALTEGGLGTLGKAIGKKIANTAKNIKNKASTAIDKLADSAMTREEKANWILANAKIDYNKVKVDEDGECIPEESNQRFGTFLIIGYTNRYTNGRTITMPPTFTNKDLVVGMDKPEEKKAYKDADNIAKGWSNQQGNGPAFIFLAKDKDDKKPVFLCEYFDGEIDKAQDQLEKYFETVKKAITGAKQRAAGGDTSNDTKVPANKIEPGMTVVIDGSKEPPVTGEVVKAEKSTLSAGAIDLTVKLANGDEKVFSGVAPGTILTVVRTKTEGLNTLMSGVEELNESVLENLISTSLIEAYQNVAGFRLNGCSYLNEELAVNGTIFFTSGNTRETSYNFTEAYTNADGKATLYGLNEKLGLDKQFTLTGYADRDTKTFITESFTYRKN